MVSYENIGPSSDQVVPRGLRYGHNPAVYHMPDHGDVSKFSMEQYFMWMSEVVPNFDATCVQRFCSSETIRRSRAAEAPQQAANAAGAGAVQGGPIALMDVPRRRAVPPGAEEEFPRVEERVIKPSDDEFHLQAAKLSKAPVRSLYVGGSDQDVGHH